MADEFTAPVDGGPAPSGPVDGGPAPSEPVGGGPAPAEPTDGGPAPAEPKGGESAEPQMPSRAQQRIRQLIEERNSLRDQVAQRQTTAPQPTPTQPTAQIPVPQTPRTTEHPALVGLERDEDGMVLFEGAYVPPSIVTDRYDQRRAIETLTARLDSFEQSRLDAQFQAKQEAVLDTVQEAIGEMRQQAFPTLPQANASDMDEVTLLVTDAVLTRLLRTEGLSWEQMTDEHVSRATRDAFVKLKGLFGVFGDAQIQNNAAYAAQHKTRPGGTPGVVPPKHPDQMTRAEREAYVDQVQRAAEAARAAG